VTKRLGILTAVIVALVAGGLALGLGLMSNSKATATKATPGAHATITSPPPTTTPPVAAAPTTVPPPPPTTAPPVATPPAVVNGIAQDNGGDQDADNNGGPSDGDGNL
jgi:hypothetical protein